MTIVCYFVEHINTIYMFEFRRPVQLLYTILNYTYVSQSLLITKIPKDDEEVHVAYTASGDSNPQQAVFQTVSSLHVQLFCHPAQIIM